MKRNFSALLLLFSIPCVFLINAQEVKLSKLFTDGMVLQQATETPIWGKAAAGTAITITGSWNNTPVNTVADINGKFIAYLSTPIASYTSYTLKVNDLIINNVLIGEVWLCSGQSNMQVSLGGTVMGSVSSDNNPYIRCFQTPYVSSTVPLDTLSDGFWRFGAVTNNMSQFSAVGYYFARRLQLALDVPIGMLGAYRGATAAEEWMNPAIFNALPENIKTPYVPNLDIKFPGCWYNGMLNPLIPYKISGVIWYQGENNAARMQTYSTILKAMVNGWRTDFKDEKLPFYLVQLPTFNPPAADWREFREIQRKIAETLPNAGFVTTVDVGEESNIHPTNKKPVGDRLGDLALARVYGKSATFNSPQFRTATTEGKAMRVLFNFAEKGLKITTGESPDLFEVAGVDGIYYPAIARIEGNTVLVWADEVAAPVKTRYMWKNYALPNLFSTDNYPVTPFKM